jgi:hypothetical protein
MPLYVYGLMQAADALAALAAPAAFEPKLRTVEHEGICALVSPVPEGPIKLRKESLLAHRDVLQAAFEHGPVLPLRFGTVVEDERAVAQELIAPRLEAIAARLAELANKVEMQLKVTYLEEPLLRSILAHDPALSRAATRMQQVPAAASHFERIRVGESIAGAVQARGATDSQALLEALSRHVVGASLSPARQEHMLLNAAFLVERSHLDEFDAAVEKASAEHAGEMAFKLIGPLPAHSFADAEAAPGSTPRTHTPPNQAATWA